MKSNAKINLSELDFRQIVLVGFIWLFNLFLIGYFVIHTLQILQSYDELALLKSDSESLRTKVNIINANNKLSDEEIDQISSALAKLVPQTENYFSVITTLETLTKKTGFNFINYSINLDSTTSQKLSLSVTGGGDMETFTKFLESYKFSGGRLITIEQLDFTQSKLDKIGLMVNFYSNTKSLPIQSPKLTDEDIEFMKEIMNQVSESE